MEHGAMEESAGAVVDKGNWGGKTWLEGEGGLGVEALK